MIRRSLLAALIAAPTLPAAAQDPVWQCRQDARGGWDCTPLAGAPPAPAPAAPVPTAVPVVAPTVADLPAATPPARLAAAAPAPDLDSGFDSAFDSGFDTWALCAARSAPPRLPAATFQDTTFDADAAELQQGRIYLLTGDVQMERAGQRLQAERLRYDRLLDEVQAEGNIRLDEAALQITGDRARLQLGGDQGEIHGVEYLIHAQHARGRAGVAYQESATRRRFEQSSYTTCDAQAESWRLDAGRVVLDEERGTGTARNVWLRLGDVPVLYTPYMSFPIDDRRKSGLLVPSWGTSDNRGSEFMQPYYWNIAPHRDATLTPRLMSERGLQMQGEFRYLNPNNLGELDLEYLPADKAYADQDRHLLRIDHRGQLGPRLRTTLYGTDVSDADYFEDLGTSLDMSSVTHLERRAQASYHGSGWNLSGMLQDYQTVDRSILPVNRPYRRLPQVLLNANPRSRPYGLELGLASELVRFDHAERIDGTRLDLYPRASLPVGGAAWFLTPTAGVRYTAYDLSDDSDPDRSLPVASLDSGLFFERNADLFGKPLLQTLEPRAFYLYVPERDQDALPILDTGQRDFSFQQMFEDNRFSGADRMGDANQLTLAVTSRLLDPASGVQHASLSLGQIQYFRDRTVTMSPAQAPQRQSGSNLVGELDLRLGPTWKALVGAQWDPHESRTERSNVRLQYRPDPRHLWNFTYRYRADALEQIDTSALWYFTPRWHGVMRWNYALPEGELLEALAGLEYESCCWVFRVLGRSYIGDLQGARNDAILFQLELKGLTSIGNPIETLLEDGILGYARH
ncbi:MAG: LPS-assembly protein LptD [Gammaproteobacteria bacterium]